MDLDWSTFLLEIINFLVLVWLLRRFLYRPVLAAIVRRQESVRSELESAEAMRADAAALQSEFEARIADQQRERDRQMAALDDEVQALRRQRLEELEREIEEARQKARADDQRKLSDTREALGMEALNQGAAFAAALLKELASPELEGLIVQMTLRYLGDLPESRWQSFREDLAEHQGTCQVSSAFGLDPDQKQALSELFSKQLHSSEPVKFQTDRSLISGLEILLGSWALGANIRDELNGFSEHPGHE